MSEQLVKPFLRRIDKPIIITFITVYIIYNWQFFYFLFSPYSSSFSGADRVELATASLNLTTWSLYFFTIPQSVVVPIFYTILALFIIPILHLIYHTIVIGSEDAENWLTQLIKGWFVEKAYAKQKERERTLKEKVRVESRIDQLKNQAYEYRLQTRNLDIEEFYKNLNPANKERLALRLYNFDKLARVIGRNAGENSTPLIEQHENGLKVTDAGIQLLHLYNEEFPGKLKDDLT